MAVSRLGMLALICTPGLCVSAWAQESKSGASLSSQCATCHGDDLVKQFGATRHGRAHAFQAWGFTESCASCHGDGTAHMESADPSKIRNPGKLKPAEVAQTCLKCHGNQQERAFWSGSAHETSNLSCLSCHRVHHARAPEKLLVKQTPNETCLACHTGLRKAQFQRSTHLFRDEWRNTRITCTDCHNPHGSQAPKMVKGNSVNETCYTCHTEKRGPFLWQHSPVQENCMTCHAPHGSNNPSLLAVRITQLCQSCHMQSLHATVAGRPNSAWIFKRLLKNYGKPLVRSLGASLSR